MIKVKLFTEIRIYKEDGRTFPFENIEAAREHFYEYLRRTQRDLAEVHTQYHIKVERFEKLINETTLELNAINEFMKQEDK